MTLPLEALIRKHIQASGHMSLPEFMHYALLHPEFGYYTTATPFGEKGDFITAPEISQVFGELIGIWCVAMWQAMGMPKKVSLVELGPGRGTLMHDLLRGTRHVEGFHQAASIYMVEASPALRQQQSDTLKGQHASITWCEQLSDVPDDAPYLLIANEFFDALPISQYVYHNQQWFERVITENDQGELCFMRGNAVPLAETGVVVPEIMSPAEGDIYEVSLPSHAICNDISKHIATSGGAAVFVDYGYAHYHGKETLQAVKKHQYRSIFHDIGQTDITAHVDFHALQQIANQAGLITSDIMPQGHFLMMLGMEQRYQMLSEAVTTQAQADDLHSRIHRLVAPEEMGELFKALTLHHPDMTPVF